MLGKINLKKIVLSILIAGVVIAFLMIPRTLRLDSGVTVDEPLWLMRSANFYQALSVRDFKNTYQKEHPGVLVTWAGTAGFLRQYPDIVKKVDYQFHGLPNFYFFLRNHLVDAVDVLASGRLFTVLLIVIASVLTFWYCLKLFGLIPALLGILLIALDPFTISLSRLLHLDGLVSALMLLSLLAFMRFMYQSRRTLDLLVSAVVAGLSWLTKSPAFFLIPFIGALVLLNLIQSWRRPDQRNARVIWSSVKPVLLWLFVACLIFVLLWPAMWVNPIWTLRQVFTQAADYAVEGHDHSTFFNGTIYLSGDLAWYFYPVSFFWRITGVVSIGIFLAILSLFLPKILKLTEEQKRYLLVLLAFSILFTIFISLSLKKFDRYQLPIQGPMILIAALGWYTIIQAVSRGLTKIASARTATIGTWAILTCLVLVQSTGVFSTYPYFYNYYNPLLGGIQRAKEVMMIGRGEELEQAAEYLNAKPHVRKLKVISWYNEGSFTYFFHGTSKFMDDNISLEQLQQADYVVLYFLQMQRQLPSPKILAYFQTLTPEYTVTIDGFDYAWVYNMKQAGEPAAP